MKKIIALLIVAFVALQGFAVLSARASWPGEKYDVDQNHRVDIADVLAVSLAFGSTPVDLNWNHFADINDDGKIRVDDMLAVALHFGMSEVPED